MKVSTERLPESQVELRIEVEDERLRKAKASAYRRLAGKVRIPGFRPGKVPPDVLERHLGEGAVLHEALDRLMPQVYREALEQEEIEPIDQARYELVTEEPLVAKFTVPVRPKVDLGDYTSLRVPREPVSVEPERVQDGLEALRHRYATFEPVDRPVQWGDILRAGVGGEIDGNTFVREEDAEFQLAEGRAISIPGFAEGLIGREKGAEFELELTVPDDAPDERLRGKEARYRVVIKELKQEVLPELDEDFARQVGEGFSDITALRSRVEADLLEALEREAERSYHDSALDALVERAQTEYPPVVIEREVERLLSEEVRAAQPAGPQARGASERETLGRFLERAGKSEDELRKELEPIAEARIRRSLVLSELAEAEHIQVTDEEVEAEIGRMTAGVGDQADEVRRLFKTEAAKESLQRSLVTRRTLERLAEIASADVAPEAAQAGASRNE